MTQAEVRKTRAERLAMPLAREVVKDLAVEHGACIRPVQLRRTSLDTGAVEKVLVPCGHTLAAVCPACAERAKTLRAAQCREGWHLEAEPVIEPDPATEDQKWWVEKRAGAQVMRDKAADNQQDTGGSSRTSCSNPTTGKIPAWLAAGSRSARCTVRRTASPGAASATA